MKKLSEKSKPYLRVNALIDMIWWLVIASVVTGLVLWFEWPGYIIWIEAGIFVLIFIINVIIRPLICFRVTSYELADEKIIVKKGFVLIRTTLISIKRIQGIELVTGAVSRRDNLSVLRAKTACMGIDLPAIAI